MFEKESLINGIKVQQLNLQNYNIVFAKVDEKLFITFEPFYPNNPLGSKKPWGFDFLSQKRNHSLLGIKPKQGDWYRKIDLHIFFRSTEFKVFVSSFKKVILYGYSMGGFAALAFAEAIPDCSVIAISPQTTMDKKKVPWETRFPLAWKQNWEGDFYDGANCSNYAKQVTIIYDPFYKLDKLHVDRLSGNNIRLLKVPFSGHAIAKALVEMRIISKLIVHLTNNTLTDYEFYLLIKARKTIPRYFINLGLRTKNSTLKRYCIDNAIKMNPTDSVALELHCLCLLHERKFEEVLTTTEKLNATGIQYAFEAYLQMGKTKEATKLLAKLVELKKPIRLAYLLNAIKFAASIKEFTIADELIAKSIEKAPNNRHILNLAKSIKDRKYPLM